MTTTRAGFGSLEAGSRARKPKPSVHQSGGGNLDFDRASHRVYHLTSRVVFCTGDFHAHNGRDLGNPCQRAIPAPSLCLRRSPMLPIVLTAFGPKTFMITEKNTGVKNIPNKLTPIIPANTAVPSA